jgi:hypothetical protein
LFRSYSFYKNFVFFQTSLSITTSYMFCFSFRSLFFWFLIFSLDSFVRVFLAFNFIIQSEFLLLYFFQFDSRSFDLFFLLLKYFSFQFNPPIKNLCLPWLLFFYFHHHFLYPFIWLIFFHSFILRYMIYLWFIFMWSYSFALVFFLNISFVILFNFFSMSLSRSHYLGLGFYMPFYNINFFYNCFVYVWFFKTLF